MKWITEDDFLFIVLALACLCASTALVLASLAVLQASWAATRLETLNELLEAVGGMRGW